MATYIYIWFKLTLIEEYTLQPLEMIMWSGKSRWKICKLWLLNFYIAVQMNNELRLRYQNHRGHVTLYSIPHRVWHYEFSILTEITRPWRTIYYVAMHLRFLEFLWFHLLAPFMPCTLFGLLFDHNLVPK